MQDENDDDDDWNPCKAAGVCLMLLSTCCEDDVVPHVLPFIKEHIENPDWRYRDASVMAFGSILEGPELNQLKSLVVQVRAPPVRQLSAVQPSIVPQASPSTLLLAHAWATRCGCVTGEPAGDCVQAIPTLIELMKDPSVVVRDTTAWTVGRICELLPEAAINEMYLPPLLQCLIEGLGAEPRVASNVCWVSLHRVASVAAGGRASQWPLPVLRLLPAEASNYLDIYTSPPPTPSGLLLPGGRCLRGHRGG